MKTLEAQLDETLLTDRLIAMLSAGFGLLATLLASIGLYGVMAFVVARRTKELGIRLALGAQPGVRHLDGDARGAAAARRSASPSAFRRRSRSAATWPRSSTASSRTTRAIADARRSLLLARRVGRGGPDPGASREPDRSDPGAARGVTRGEAIRTQGPQWMTSPTLTLEKDSLGFLTSRLRSSKSCSDLRYR